MATIWRRPSGSSLLTQYSYRHGYYDGTEREYRGFARVEQRDAETPCGGVEGLTTPPCRTVTWFHTGAFLGRQGLERELAKEYYQDDPEAPLLSDTGRLLSASTEMELESVHEQVEAVRAFKGNC